MAEFKGNRVERMTSFVLFSSATTVSDAAPNNNGAKSKPRQRGDWG
jgi:hypothetical protein